MRRLVLASMLGFLGLACGSDTVSPEDTVTALVVTAARDTLFFAGDSILLDAVASDASGAPVQLVAIAWSSSDDEVATVNQAGTVTAAGPHGMVTITASVGGSSGQATIVVVAGPQGGGFSEEGGRVTLDIPPEALTTAVQISVAVVASPLPSLALVPETVYDLGPDGLQFAKPVELTLSYDPSRLPEGMLERSLRVATVRAGEWTTVQGSTVDSVANTVTAPITGFSVYGILGNAGLVLILENEFSAPPAEISIFFKVELDDGTPVATLTKDDFELFEDGDRVDPNESDRTIDPNPGTFLSPATLLLDLSGSILGSGTLPTLQTAAKTFVQQVLEPDPNRRGEVDLAIFWFDGEADLHSLTPPSADIQVHTDAIDAITEGISSDNTTDLNGAVIHGAQEVTERVDAVPSPTVAVGSLIIFTDGRDLAKRHTKPDVLDVIDALPIEVAVYTVGLGENIDRTTLQEFGTHGSVFAESVGDLVETFREISDRVNADVKSHYLLRYCAQARAGQHALTVKAMLDDFTGQLETTFSAAGFGGGCTVTP